MFHVTFGTEGVILNSRKSVIAGYNKNEMNNTALPYIMGHTPAGTSTWNMIHYAQVVYHTTLQLVHPHGI